MHQNVKLLSNNPYFMQHSFPLPTILQKILIFTAEAAQNFRVVMIGLFVN